MLVGLIIGIILIAVGVLLIFLRSKKQNALLEIKSTQTSTAKELQEMCASINQELGSSGGFRQLAEVKGMIKCDSPLTGELSKQPCVYYDMKVEERYEETYYEKDSQGNQTRKTRTSNTTVSSNSQRVNFFVEDETGRVQVNPNSADMDPIQVVSKYEPHTSNRTSVTFGGFSFNVSAGTNSDRKILGYEFTEKIIPLERKVYVLGEATDSSGELMIQQPKEKGKPYIITLKSEEELTKSTESAIKGFMIGAIACWVLGTAAIVFGIFSGK
jgi:hypothetical protein